MALTWGGYAGKPYASEDEAKLSHFSDYGQVTDNVTGYIGTPQQIAERYIKENRDISDLQRRMGR